MMMKLAAFIMSGWPRAVAVVVLAAVLTLIFPPSMLISGAALALVTLRLGAGQGLLVLAISAVLTALLTIVLPGFQAISLFYSMVQWLPLLLVSLVLRYTVSLGQSLVVAGLMGLLAILAIHASVPDTDHFWMAQLDAYVRPSLEQLKVPGHDINQMFSRLAYLMTGKLVASSLLVLTVMLLLARWWQALLYNPGGFRREFRLLRLGYPAAAVMLVLFAMTFMIHTNLVTELAIVGVALFFLQGMAIVHSVVTLSASPLPWLVATYTLLFVLPQMMAALAALGVIDTFADVRARLRTV